MQESLQLALAQLLPKKEHFLDYMTLTSTSSLKPNKDSDDVLFIQYNTHLAKIGVATARRYLIRQDIPFRAPDDFTPEMFRPTFITNRISKISAKKELELQSQQDIRKRRIERQRQVALQHGKRMGKHAQVRMQKEIIELWKKQREQAAKQGVDQDKLPTLEQIEKKYQVQQKHNRLQKNVKYGGAKLKSQMQKKLSKSKTRMHKQK